MSIIGRVTAERITLTKQLAAGEVRRSTARCRQQIPRKGELGHLEGDVTDAADDLRADLDSFSFGFVSDYSLIGSGVASAQKIAEIVGERTQLKANRVDGERLARKARP